MFVRLGTGVHAFSLTESEKIRLFSPRVRDEEDTKENPHTLPPSPAGMERKNTLCLHLYIHSNRTESSEKEKVQKFFICTRT